MDVSRWREVSIFPRAAGMRANPYYEWLRKTRFAYYGSSDWLPVLFELKAPTTAQDFAHTVFEMQKRKEHERDWAAGLRIPPFYRTRPERLTRPTRFLAGLATRKFLEDVYAGASPSGAIERFEIGCEIKLSTGNPPSGGPKPGKKKIPPKSVLTGVIDDGIGFAHDRFWSKDGTTRIEYVWDQLEPSTVWGDWGYGRQIDKYDPAEGINKRMADSRTGRLVDEDKFYRLTKQVDHTQRGHKSLARRAAHGTHVMDIACNAGRTPPDPETRPIVAVQLPTATTADTSGATLGPQIYNGLTYIVDRAEAIASDGSCGQLPVVVNVSYGLIAGPHDGSSVLEQAMDDLLKSCNPVDSNGKPTTPPFRVVLPAGNNYLSRCHAHFDLPAKTARTLHWRVLPDDWTESHVEIWLPDKDDNGHAVNLSVTVTAPDGDATSAFSAGIAHELVIGGQVVGWAVYFAPGAAGRRALLRLTLAPTGAPDGGVSLAPAGLWRIGIDNASGQAQVSDLHAWIQRDDTPVGYARRGRQSYFDDPDYARFDSQGRLIKDDTDVLTSRSYVKRSGTINAIATGTEPIVVAGIRRSDWATAKYSGAGPVANHPPGRGQPQPKGPDVMTVSDDTPSHHGVLGAGARSGSCAAMHGTSVAAPQIARWIAEELALNRPGGRQDVTDYTKKMVAAPLYTEKNPPGGAVPKPAAERGGAGRVEFPPARTSRVERF